MPYENNSRENIHWGFLVAQEKTWKFSLREHMQGFQENLETKNIWIIYLFLYILMYK